jgi:hypothetical protein
MASVTDRASVVVLTLSMGVAELLLYRYRSLILGTLRRTRMPGRFRLRAAQVLLWCLAQYLCVLAVPAVVAGVPLGPLLALGAALWVALLLQAFGIAWLSASVCLTAAGAQAALWAAGLPPAVAQSAVCGCATALLLVTAGGRLGLVTAHR